MHGGRFNEIILAFRNASDVIGHLIEGEKNDWITRITIILQDGESTLFPLFDMNAHLNDYRPIEQKLTEFKVLRFRNLDTIKSLINHERDLDLTGFHPKLGVVNIRQLLSTWVVHDLNHIRQIARVLAERYRDDVGPWIQYLGILNKK